MNSYEYVTENTQRIEDIAKLCTQRSREGWEYVDSCPSPGGMTGRYVLIFRREAKS